MLLPSLLTLPEIETIAPSTATRAPKTAATATAVTIRPIESESMTHPAKVCRECAGTKMGADLVVQIAR